MLREYCIFHWWERGVTLPHSLHIFILFFHLFLEFYIGEEGKKFMMKYLERRRILVALALNWFLHVFVQHVLDIQTLALNEECPNFYHLL